MNSSAINRNTVQQDTIYTVNQLKGDHTRLPTSDSFRENACSRSQFKRSNSLSLDTEEGRKIKLAAQEFIFESIHGYLDD
jgi:hypothetical protein